MNSSALNRFVFSFSSNIKEYHVVVAVIYFYCYPLIPVVSVRLRKGYSTEIILTHKTFCENNTFSSQYTVKWLLEEMVCYKNVLKTYLYLAEEFVILNSGQYSLNSVYGYNVFIGK